MIFGFVKVIRIIGIGKSRGNVQTLYRHINSEELIMYIVIHHIDWDHSIRKGNEYSYEYEDANLNSYSLCNCAQHFVMNAWCECDVVCCWNYNWWVLLSLIIWQIQARHDQAVYNMLEVTCVNIHSSSNQCLHSTNYTIGELSKFIELTRSLW